jgi:hypothetical protein
VISLTLELFIMSTQDRFKIITYAPKTHEDAVKQAGTPRRFLQYRKMLTPTFSCAALLCHTAFKAGAGQIGAYQNVSFTTPGLSEFTPAADAKPAIGTPGVAEKVDEVRIEITAVGRDVVRCAVDEIRRVHPYEEVVVDVVRLEEF